MTAAVIRGVLLLLFMSTVLSAESCKQYEDAYLMAEMKKNETKKATYRERYDMASSFIDSAIYYLAYCKGTVSLADQYQITKKIRREDKKRRDYFRGAVREYHAIYGIRPNVTEIYQDGRYGNGADRKTSRPPTPRFPPVQQPMMPPVQQPMMPPVQPAIPR